MTDQTSSDLRTSTVEDLYVALRDLVAAQDPEQRRRLASELVEAAMNTRHAYCEDADASEPQEILRVFRTDTGVNVGVGLRYDEDRSVAEDLLEWGQILYLILRNVARGFGQLITDEDGLPMSTEQIESDLLAAVLVHSRATAMDPVDGPESDPELKN